VPGFHRLRASTTEHQEEEVKSRVNKNETVVITVRPTEENLVAISRRLKVELQRKTGILILRTATAHPTVRHTIRHASDFVSAKSKKSFRGAIPAVLKQFPSGTFKVSFSQNGQVVHDSFVLEKGDILNLKADFRRKKIIRILKRE
jgi:hypothetical protein